MPSASPHRRDPLATHLIPLAVALVVLTLAQARFMGDTIDYVHSSFEFDHASWDFGHLFWVPLGYLAQTLFGLKPIGVVWTFLVINALCGALSVVLLRLCLGRVGIRPWTAALTSLALLFSQAMLNYTLSGCSYVPGLTLTLLALYAVLSPQESPRGAWLAAVGAGLAMGVAVCFWFPYVLVVPGVLLAPIILYGIDRRRTGLVVVGGLAIGLFLLASYGPAAWEVGVRDWPGLRAWVARSSHGVRTGGAARMVFGLGRSFIFMGDDGLLFKRHLLHDPYNPVSRRDLIGASLWKLAFFYLALAALAVQLLRTTSGRRLAVLALVGGVPVLVFGLFWQGGDMERYMPLYPFFFIALAGACDTPGWAAVRWLPAGFFAVAAVVNGYAHSRPVVTHYQNTLADRVRDLRPVLKPGSWLIVVRDRLKLLPRDFPLDPVGEGLRVHETATPGLATTDAWQADFACVALRAWDGAGDVWLSKRLLQSRPPADGTWVEGEDKRLKWSKVTSFFKSWATDEEVGGDDGFVRLRQTPAQRRRLERLAAGS